MQAGVHQSCLLQVSRGWHADASPRASKRPGGAQLLLVLQVQWLTCT